MKQQQRINKSTDGFAAESGCVNYSLLKGANAASGGRQEDEWGERV